MLNVVLSIINIILISNRLYIRIFRRYKLNFNCVWNAKMALASDCLVALSWAITKIPQLVSLTSTRVQYGSYMVGGSYPDLSLPPDEYLGFVMTLLKFEFMEQALYYPGLYFVKAAMLCFYAEIVPRFLRKTWLVIYIAWCLVIGGLTTTILVYVLICYPEPPSAAWYVSI